MEVEDVFLQRYDVVQSAKFYLWGKSLLNRELTSSTKYSIWWRDFKANIEGLQLKEDEQVVEMDFQ